MVEVPVLRGPGGRPLRLAHLTTVDMSLELLLGTELQVDVATGMETFGMSASGPHVAAVEAMGCATSPSRPSPAHGTPAATWGGPGAGPADP